MVGNGRRHRRVSGRLCEVVDREERHAEEIRDAMLAASGRLVLQRPRGSPAQDLKVIELPDNGPIAKRYVE